MAPLSPLRTARVGTVSTSERFSMMISTDAEVPPYTSSTSPVRLTVTGKAAPPEVLVVATRRTEVTVP